jgi:hypothetical protein
MKTLSKPQVGGAGWIGLVCGGRLRVRLLDKVRAERLQVVVCSALSCASLARSLVHACVGQQAPQLLLEAVSLPKFVAEWRQAGHSGAFGACILPLSLSLPLPPPP